jgi:hypothetical protein
MSARLQALSLGNGRYGILRGRATPREAQEMSGTRRSSGIALYRRLMSEARQFA